MLPGPYRVPAYRGTAHVRLTNKTPAGTYRGPGRFECTLARERLIDAIAAAVGKASDEVRRVNLIPKHLMPYDRGFKTLDTPLILDSGDYAGLLARFHEQFDTRDTRERVARRRAAGEAVGFGHAFFVEKSGLGPFEGARVTLESDGTIEIVTGAASLGQGLETVLAQIAAQTLGAPISAFRVIHGQTDRIGEGYGSFASRATAMAGPAVAAASERLKDRILEVAAVRLQRPPATLALASGLIVPMDGTISPWLTLAEAARGAEKPLTEEQWFRAGEMNYPYGIHGAVVAVDTETGAVRVEQIFIAYDVGRAINPMLICGQLAGGMAQGVGGALFEEFRYDDNGQPLSVTFADYLVPTAAEIPPVDILITEDAPSPVNPLGIKGAGEGGLTGIGAAIASAIDDAIGQKVAVRRLPLTAAGLRKILKERALSSVS
jgi:CO/xanthine dehydrogenase Mo-binding subunit